MTLDVAEETQASHSRSIVPLRGGERFSQDIAHSVVGMPDRKLTFVYFHGIITRIEITVSPARARLLHSISIQDQLRYMDFLNEVERR